MPSPGPQAVTPFVILPRPDIPFALAGAELARAVLEAAADPIVVVDHTGRIIDCNPAVERAFGYRRSEIIGQPVSGTLVPLRTTGTNLEGWDRHFAAGEERVLGRRVRITGLHESGHHFPVELVLAPISSEQPPVFAAFMRDLSHSEDNGGSRLQTERSFRALFENSWDAISLLSASGMIVYASPASRRVFGYGTERIGREAIGFVHPEDRDAYRCAFVASLQQPGVGTPWRARARHKDGTWRMLDGFFTNLLDDPSVEAVISNYRDVTETEQAQEAIRRSEARLALAQQVSHTGSWELLIDDDAAPTLESPIWWSDETFRIFGLEPGSVEVTLRRFTDAVHPQDGARVEQSFFETVRTGNRYSIDHRILLPDATERFVHEEAYLVRDNETGARIKVVGTVQDITAWKQAEALLREQAEMLNLAHDAIIVRSYDDEEIVFWNTGAERLYGWRADEAIGRCFSELLVDEREQSGAAHVSPANRDEPYRGEVRHRTKDGREVIVSTRATLVQKADGTPHSVLIINTDVTEHKRLEAQFLRAQRLESLGTLASGVAHDLNNILAPILMSAPLLYDDLSPESKATIISTIEDSAERGAQIVKQVLTFARGVEGKRVLLGPIHLIKEIVQIARETFPKSITLTTRYSDDLWTVEGDPTQLHQVLLNLAVNARDVMPQGGTMTVSAENFHVDAHYAGMMPDAKAGPHVLLSVTDTGTGIPHDNINKIFDPFFTTKEVGKGSGLGLSTVLGIVKSHNGFIAVQSDIGTGTTFKVFLPANADGDAISDNAPARELPLGNGESILIVDDEAGVASVSKLILEKKNYKVFTAQDGPEAIAIFAKHSEEIRLVISDLMMPWMDGVALIRTLKRMKPALAAIASTGFADESRVSELAVLGVHDCLSKPYDTAQLLETVHSALTQNGQA